MSIVRFPTPKEVKNLENRNENALLRTNLTVYDQLITKRSKQTQIQIYLTKQKGPKTSKTGLSTDLISKSFLHLRGLIEVYINTDHSPILIQKNVKTADYRTIPYICNL